MPTYPPLKLTYFDFKGRAEASRLTLFMGDVPFVDERLTREQFAARRASLPHGLLPVLEVDGEVVAESQAILRYAARLANMYPLNDPMAALMTDEVLASLDEMFERLLLPSFVEPDAEKKKHMREAALAGPLPKNLAQIEARLQLFARHPTFQTDRIYVHDVYVWALTAMFKRGIMDHIPVTLTDEFATMNAIYKKVATHPKTQLFVATQPHRAPKRLKLTYFDMSGRAEQIRLAFHIGGIAFEDERLTSEQFASRKASLPYGQVPVLEVDGEVVAESQAILRYAARLANMYPLNDPMAALMVDEVLASLDEMSERLILPSFLEPDAEKKKLMREALMAGPLQKNLAQIEARLQLFARHPTFQTDKVYVHDVCVWDWIAMFKSGILDHIPATLADEFATMNAMYEKVATHPKTRLFVATQPHRAPKRLKLTYFNMSGRADAIRLAFYIGAIAFEDERLTREQFASRKASLPYGQMPVLEVDGQVLAQSHAILRYAGTLTGLYPATDPLRSMKIDEVISHIEDLFVATGPSFAETDPEKKRAMREKLARETIPQLLASLEKRLALWKNGAYAMGPTLTIADLYVHSLVSFLRSGFMDHVPVTIVDAYRNVVSVSEEVAKHPRVADWFAAHPARLP